MVFLASWKITSSCFFNLICPGRPRFESSLFSNKKQSCSVCMHFIYCQHVACKDRAYIGKIFEPLKLLIDSSNWLNGNHKTGQYKEWPQDLTHTCTHRTWLVIQWLRIGLPMQGTWDDSWSQRSPPAAEQLSSMATTTEPVYCNYWSPSAWRPMLSNKRSLHNEKLVFCNWRAAPADHN